MPTGLTEGTETLVMYTLWLAAPAAFVPLLAVFTAAVYFTTGQRLVWAVRHM